MFADTVRGYATVTPEHTSVRFSESSQRYALYPVWLLNTTWHNNKYTFAMNGQTGKFVGNLPVDRGAYWKWFALIAAVVSLVTFGIISLIKFL